MKTKTGNLGLASIALLALTIAGVHTVVAQGTAFTYQGSLADGVTPANAAYDFRFSIYAVASGGSVAAGPVDAGDVEVSNGLFTVTLDFGATVFTGADRWLEIGVRPGASAGAYTNLVPRQKITAAPHAMFAGGVNAAGIIGTVADSQLSANIARLNGNAVFTGAVVFSNAASQFTGSFAGNGAGLTALNAGQLTSGAVPDARLGANVARTNQVWLLGGNTDAAPGANFLGTTDEQSLELRVNGARALRLEPNATSPNVIGGYAGNSVSPGFFGATIAGGGRDGLMHTISAHHGTIGGGDRNTVNGENGTIAGGGGNIVAENYASVGGGLFNVNVGFVGTIAGGRSNTIQFASDSATISGGYVNLIQTNARAATLGGGYLNTIQANAITATIGGGYENTVRTDASFATISGGQVNTIQSNATHATIGGGNLNTIQPDSIGTTIGGGQRNTIEPADSATIGGGYGNQIGLYSSFATIGGGVVNAIQQGADSATIGGGFRNWILPGARYATIPGGYQNSAASYAFAAGNLAKANHTGAFVWADSQEAFFASTAANQFCIRASGGVQLSGDTSMSFGTTTRQMLDFYGQGFGIGVQTGTLYARSNTRFSWFKDGSHNDLENNPGGGSVLMTLTSGGLTVSSNITAPSMSFGSTLGSKINLYSTTFGIGIQSGWQYSRVGSGGAFAWYTGGAHSDTGGSSGGGGTLMTLTSGGLAVNGLFVHASDRNLKENFAPVQPREVLEKVLALPLSSWNLKADPATRHLGPMAQDFYAAFNLGVDDKHIATVDADGVALAAIQGLNQKLEEKDAELQALKQTVAELKTAFDQLSRAQPANPAPR